MAANIKLQKLFSMKSILEAINMEFFIAYEIILIFVLYGRTILNSTWAWEMIVHYYNNNYK